MHMHIKVKKMLKVVIIRVLIDARIYCKNKKGILCIRFTSFYYCAKKKFSKMEKKTKKKTKISRIFVYIFVPIKFSQIYAPLAPIQVCSTLCDRTPAFSHKFRVLFFAGLMWHVTVSRNENQNQPPHSISSYMYTTRRI